MRLTKTSNSWRMLRVIFFTPSLVSLQTLFRSITAGKSVAVVVLNYDEPDPSTLITGSVAVLPGPTLKWRTAVGPCVNRSIA